MSSSCGPCISHSALFCALPVKRESQDFPGTRSLLAGSSRSVRALGLLQGPALNALPSRGSHLDFLGFPSLLRSATELCGCPESPSGTSIHSFPFVCRLRPALARGPCKPTASRSRRAGSGPDVPSPSGPPLSQSHLLGRLRVEHQHQAGRVTVQPQEMVEEPVGAEPAGAHHQPVAVEQFQHQLPLVLQQRRHCLAYSQEALLHRSPSGAAAR